MNTKQELINEVRNKLGELDTEIEERNAKIEKRDSYVYGDYLEDNIAVPVGHDKTPINWLRRAVEIHRDIFMGRGFTPASTYDTVDPDTAQSDEERQQIDAENKQRKVRADNRTSIITATIADNGGFNLFKGMAESASAVGFSVLEVFWNPEEQKVEWVPIENVENFRAYWNSDNFRDTDMYAFTYQISPQKAIEDYGLEPGELVTSARGAPISESLTVASSQTTTSTQEMVTVIRVTGKIPGFKSEKGRIKTARRGKETPMSLTIVGNKVVKVVDKPNRMPRYFIFPNKLQRRRPWGVSDLSDAAIEMNLTYIEAFSDWRTIANKVNFPKYRFFNFGPDAQIPKFEPRKIQGIPLGADQDIQLLAQGDPNSIDWNRQLDEIKSQYLNEVAISRVLFDDPTVDYNSNQALMTGMKITTDVAEAKKALWTPVLIDLFKTTLELAVANVKGLDDLTAENENWEYKIKWPSVMQKEDPVYQQMLLNRWNARTMSLRTFLEEQGETGEELERIKDEMNDPLTAAIHAQAIQLVAQRHFQPDGPQPDVKVSLRGDLTPYQEANLASMQGFNDGPFPATAGPQGTQGRIAQENADNQGFIEGNPFNGGTPIQQGPDGQPVPQVATQANNTEGSQPMSQPGTGAPPVSAQGAINTNNQNNGA